MSHHEQLEQRGAFLGWFLAGAVIGAAVAILYAPKAGRDTREAISKTARESRDAVNETTREVVERGREIYERGRTLIEDAADLFERGRKLVRG